MNTWKQKEEKMTTSKHNLLHNRQSSSVQIIGTKNKFTQQYLLGKGIKIFGNKDTKWAIKEAKQPHNRECFRPIDVSKQSERERKGTQRTLSYLWQKRDGMIKGQTVYDRSRTRE